MFTLKLTEINGTIYPYDKHGYGGIDVEQILAFKHLIPDGFCDKFYENDLLSLARMHGWKVEWHNTENPEENQSFQEVKEFINKVTEWEKRSENSKDLVV